ncbi:MAG: GNAT family N-acetyltransferase [Pseudomonadota bacterium]|nr:GNAT family N-acetyltransferase [Pseudomonadota bacterium]
MADGGDAFSARTVSSIEEIGRDRWDRLANPDPNNFNPFVAYDFLHALEASKSVGGESGWLPGHIALEQSGALTGVAPLYAKAHSQGEYVFDHHWADAYERAGGRYYPKFVAAVPFTPVPGPRLLAADSDNRAALAAAAVEVARRTGASSVHANFLRVEDQDAFLLAGALPRTGVQYHWFNRGFGSFDDFLSTLASRKRKAIRRERREAVEAGLVIKRLQGDAIEERHWDAMWAFYQDTGSRKWGRPYLTRSFFRLIGESMADRCLLIFAERNDAPVAGALNFIGGDALYGRYWGCTEDYPFLHFELCYHQAVEYAIAHGLSRVEAGAQGEHKIARGYEPVVTLSAHWIADPGFRTAIERYLESERAQTGTEIAALAAMTPFRKG